MQLHRQLPELREGGAGRGEDLSNLGAEQHYGGPAARRPTPASDPPAPRPARTSREPGRGPTLPWPPGSAVREGGRTLVDADVMAPRTSSRRRSAAATTTRAGNHGEPGSRPLGLPRRKSRPPRGGLAETRPLPCHSRGPAARRKTRWKTSLHFRLASFHFRRRVGTPRPGRSQPLPARNRPLPESTDSKLRGNRFFLL